MCGDTPQSGDFMLFEMLDQVRVSTRNISASFVEVQGSCVEMQDTHTHSRLCCGGAGLFCEDSDRM